MLTENLSFPVAPNDLQPAIAQEPWYATPMWQNERSSRVLLGILCAQF